MQTMPGFAECDQSRVDSDRTVVSKRIINQKLRSIAASLPLSR